MSGFPPSGWGVEPWGSPGGGGGGLPPVVINVTPATGTLLQPDAFVDFDVVDVDSPMRRIIILVRYPHISVREAIYEIPGLTPQFASDSTVTPIVNGFHFHLRRLGGWPDTEISLMVDAIDVDGNEN